MKRLLQLSFSLALIFAPLTLVTGPTDAAIIQALGDDFVLKAGGDVITGGHSWRVYDPSVFLSDNISIRIFDITSGVPNISPIYSNDTAPVTRIDTNVKFGPVDVFEYSVDISPISLSPETPYLLSIANGTGPDIWFWFTSQASGENDAGPWSPDPNTFPIGTGLSSVPEPSTLLLFGAGLAGVGLLRRRVKR